MRRWTALLILLAAACGPQRNNDQAARDDAGVREPDAHTDAAATDAAADAGPDTDAGAGEVVREDLEVVLDREVTIQDGYGGRLAFDVPDDAVSVVVSVTGEGARFYSLAEWKNGDGSDVVASNWLSADQAAPDLCLSCPNRIASSKAAFAAILPNNESTEVVPGTHNIDVYAYSKSGFAASPLASGTAQVRVVVKRASAAPEAGILDINFHLTGAAGLTAETAPNDADFQQALADLEELYSQVGLRLGTITYTDIGEEYQVIESVLFSQSDLQELFSLSVDAPRHALNVFIVEELISEIGGVLLGVSGGIPGPAIGGTARSGVAIATKRTPEVDTEMFKVIGHEVGHHLGLFHTSEQDFGAGASVHDPIEDTPEGDATLLMYYFGSGTKITATQGRVMRLNPWVRHEGGDQ